MPSKTKDIRKKLAKRRRTVRRSMLFNNKKSQLVKMFLEMLNVVKLYHWKTHSYAQHKDTDELYQKINEHIDTFIEVYLGKNPRVDLSKVKSIPLHDFNSITNFEKLIEKYKSFLISIQLENKDSDLLTIRDELLTDLNQFNYLLTLS